MPVHALSRVAVQGHVSGLADVVALTLLRVVEWKILLFACLPQTHAACFQPAMDALSCLAWENKFHL